MDRWNNLITLLRQCVDEGQGCDQFVYDIRVDTGYSYIDLMSCTIRCLHYFQQNKIKEKAQKALQSINA